MKTHDKIVQVIYRLVKENDDGRYSADQVWKEKKVLQLKEKGIKYEPDIHALTRNQEIEVYEVWLGETWDKAVTDILHSLRIENLSLLCIVPVKMHRKYQNNPGLIWTKEDPEKIRAFLLPLLNESRKKLLQLKFKIIEIDEDLLQDESNSELEAYIRSKLDAF